VDGNAKHATRTTWVDMFSVLRTTGKGQILRRLMPILPAVIGLLVMGLFAYLGLNALDRVSRQAQLIVDRNLQNTVRISEISARARELNGDFYRLATLRAANVDGLDVNGDLARIGSQVDQLVADLRAFRDERASASQAGAITQAIEQLGSYRQALEFVGSMLDLDFASAVTFIRPFNSLFDNLTTLLQGMTDTTVADARQLSKEAGASTQEIGRWFVLIAIGVAAAVAIFGWLAGKRQERFLFSTMVLEREVAERTADLQTAKLEAESAYHALKAAQTKLIQVEKMASLGQLTAGIAHEIKNPLNFVNNFSDLSVDLLDELHQAVGPDMIELTPDVRAEVDDLTATLKSNLEKIAQHGRRADNIVKNMLLHSRSGASEHRAIDLNATVQEALGLAFHGARAGKPGFNVTMQTELDPNAGMVDLYPQEFTRVILNLVGNGFYAASQRAEQTAEPGFEPTLRTTTRDLGDRVEIRVRDNGAGIPLDLRNKIFDPFFTTKPAGEGTGLGLSLSHDIVVKQHGGDLSVDSQIDCFTEFVVTLPREMASDRNPA